MVMLSKWVLRMLSLHLFLFKIVFNLFKSYSVKINFSDASCPAQHFADCADCQANVCWHVMDYYFDFYDFTQPFRYTWYCWVEGFNRDKVRWGVSVFWDYDVMIFYCNCRTEWVHSTTLLRPLFTNFLFRHSWDRKWGCWCKICTVTTPFVWCPTRSHYTIMIFTADHTKKIIDCNYDNNRNKIFAIIWNKISSLSRVKSNLNKWMAMHYAVRRGTYSSGFSTFVLP